MLAGWHARNGVSLGNPRLGFVCTKQAVDGQSALEGYYYEYDHDLAPEERLRFARHEDAPDFDPARAPRLPTASWPAERLAKAHRNYAMGYIRTALPVAVDLWGPDEARDLLGLTGRLVGMQFHHETALRLGLAPESSAASFAEFMRRLIEAQGDTCEVQHSANSVRVRQSGWKLMEDLPGAHLAVAQAYNGLMEGALAAHHHRLALHTDIHQHEGQFNFEWTIRHPARSV
jgi:hypothetical protein